MISNLLHTLGASLQQVSGRSGGSGSSSSRSSGTTTAQRTFAEVKATDPLGIYVVPFSSGYGIILTDGVNNWNVVMAGNETVEDALDSILTKYYKYSLLPQQAENGTYIQNSSGHRGSTNGSYLRGWITDWMGITDSKGDKEFDAQYNVTNYRINADAADYNDALSQGLLRTLNEVIASGNVLKKVFYIPYGYYYIGKDINTSPVADIDAASGGKMSGDVYKANQEVKDVTDWIGDNDEESPPPAATTQPAKLSKKQKILYVLMAVGTVLFFMMDSDTDNYKQKKRR